MDPRDRVFEAVLAAGVAVEQVGLADGVYFDILDDGTITLVLGEEGEEEIDDLDEALARIDEYGERYGGIGGRPGAIMVFVQRLEQLVAGAAPGTIRDRLSAREDDVDAIAGRLGLEQVSHVEIDGSEVAADEVDDIGLFEDGNGVIWRVSVDGDEIIYELVR